MRNVVFTDAADEPNITTEALEYLMFLGSLSVNFWTTAPYPGPYHVQRNKLYEVYRLYDDTQGAFVTGVLPGDKG